MASPLITKFFMRSLAGRLPIKTPCVRLRMLSLPTKLVMGCCSSEEVKCAHICAFTPDGLSRSFLTPPSASLQRIKSTCESGCALLRIGRCHVWRTPSCANISGFCHSNRGIHSGVASLAGHNKWSKVKYIKGPKDIERSKIFTKIGIQLKIAIKEGGPNPETNATLAHLISLAKSRSMPKTTIEAMLKKAAASKQGYNQATFEVRGPGNSSILVNVLTGNAKKTRSDLHYFANKNGGTLGEQGSAMHSFQLKGVVTIPAEREERRSLTFDEAEELAINVGAEEVQMGEDDDGQAIFIIVCDPSDLRSVRDGLTDRSHPFQSCSLEYIAQTTVALSEADMEAAAALISTLEGQEDTVKVFDNIVSRD